MDWSGGEGMNELDMEESSTERMGEIGRISQKFAPFGGSRARPGP